jgi:NADH dehydrogenase
MLHRTECRLILASLLLLQTDAFCTPKRSFLWSTNKSESSVSQRLFSEPEGSDKGLLMFDSEDDARDNNPKDDLDFIQKDLGNYDLLLDKPKSLLSADLTAGNMRVFDVVVDQTMNVEDQIILNDALEDSYLRILSTEVGVKKFLGQPSKPATQFLPFDILLGRTFDTIEDVVTILSRKPYEYGLKVVDSNVVKKTVVVLGSGWAAHALMKVADTYKIRLIVVSPVNHFVFTPMLAAAAVGSVEYRSTTEAVRSSNPMVEYIQGKAVDVDIKSKTIKVELNSLLENAYRNSPKPQLIDMEYDYLVCAVGTKVQNSMVPGADKHCYYLKTSDDSRKLRTAVGEALEYASRPDAAGPTHQEERSRRVTFCIVGGGPTGVELAGELSDLFKDICRPRKGAYSKLAKDVRIMLIHGGPDLVPAFDKDLRAHALNSLQKKGVEVRLDTYTTEVGDGFVVLKNKHTGEEEVVPVGISVWAAGVQAVPFIKKMLDQLPASALGKNGRINVDRWMRAPVPSEDLQGSIYVLGDAAAVQDEDAEGGLLPQTAQVAGQQGAYLARLLNRGYSMTVTPPHLAEENVDNLMRMWLQMRGREDAAVFTFLNLGLLAYVGGGEALAAVQIGDVPIMSYAGSIGFVLWRSVYLVKQVATRNRVLVSFDWMKTALFGRDMTRL